MAGISDDVYNMDSRAGAISEAIESGIDIDSVRQTATHSDVSMTQRYNRGTYLIKSTSVMNHRKLLRSV